VYIYKLQIILDYIYPKTKNLYLCQSLFRRVAFRCAGNSHPILIHVAHLAWSSGRQWLTSGGVEWGDNWNMGRLLDVFFCLGPLIENEKTLGFNEL